MNKYFPVYVAILGVLALLLFLSPQISRFISADSQVSSPELLKNVDFSKESINNYAWKRKVNNSSNSIKVQDSQLEITNSPLDKSTSYTLIDQKVDLTEGKLYRLSANYTWNNKKEDSSASFGIQKNGDTSAFASIFSIPSNPATNSIEAIIQVDQTFKNDYFYFLLSGDASISISSFSITEVQDKTISPTTPDKENLLPIPELQASPVPSPSPVLIETASPKPFDSAVFSPLPSPSPSSFASSTSSVVAQTGGKTTFYPGWSVVGFDANSKSDLFSTNNLDAYQMLGSKWLKSSDSSAIFRSNAGALVYSSNSANKTFNVTDTKSEASLVPALGWNLLYNSSDKEITDDSSYFFSNGKTQPKEFKLKELVANKSASPEVYLVSGDQNGVTLNKISFPSEAIPAKSVFWFYLSKLS